MQERMKFASRMNMNLYERVLNDYVSFDKLWFVVRATMVVVEILVHTLVARCMIHRSLLTNQY